MSVLRRLWAFLVVDFTGLVRDRMALFFIIILPLAAVFGIGLLTGGAADARLPVGVVVDDTSAQAAQLADRIAADDSLTVTRVDDSDLLQEGIAHGRFVAGLVVPEDYGARLAAGDTVTLTVYEGAAGSAQVARAALGSVVSAQAGEVTAARFAESAGTGSIAAAAEAALLAPEMTATTSVDVVAVAGDALSVPGFTGVAYKILILFMTITAVTSAGTIAERKEQGVARRSLVTPATEGELVGGFTVARFVLLLATGVLLVVATRVLFAVRWGDLVAVAAVLVVYSLVCVGLVAVVGTLYRTSSQAGSVGPWVGIVMGMLGGCMWPLEIVPPFMRVIGHLLPTAWGVDALRIVVVGGGGLGDIWLQLGVLVCFAVALLTIGGLRMRASLASA